MKRAPHKAVRYVWFVGLALVALLTVWFVYSPNKNIPKSNASNESALLDTKADWDAQTKDGNIDTDSQPGSVVLKKEDDSYNADGTWTADANLGDLPKAHDLNLGTFFQLSKGGLPGNATYAEHDFVAAKKISKIKLWMVRTFDPPVLAKYYLQYKDGGVWTTILEKEIGGGWGTWDIQDLTVDISTDALRVILLDDNNLAEVYEMQDYSPVYNSSGIITSGATQIGDANIWQWQTFSPTYTEPANTDISFKFRTSADGATWNSWTASQTVASGGSLNLIPLVASWSGTEENPGTFYKYIQVETTMTSTDGVSTPTLSDYTIGYHSNVKPDAPTAQSVVIGS